MAEVASTTEESRIGSESFEGEGFEGEEDRGRSYDEWREALASHMSSYNGKHPCDLDMDFREMYERDLTPEEALDEVREEIARLWGFSA